MLEEGGPERNGVVCAGVCASTKAGGHAVDGEAGFDLGGDDATGGVVGSTEVLAGREAKGRRGGRRGGRGNMAGNGGDLGEGEVAAGEGDRGTRAAGGQRGRGGRGRRGTHR